MKRVLNLLAISTLTTSSISTSMGFINPNETKAKHPNDSGILNNLTLNLDETWVNKDISNIDNSYFLKEEYKKYYTISDADLANITFLPYILQEGINRISYKTKTSSTIYKTKLNVDNLTSTWLINGKLRSDWKAAPQFTITIKMTGYEYNFFDLLFNSCNTGEEWGHALLGFTPIGFWKKASLQIEKTFENAKSYMTYFFNRKIKIVNNDFTNAFLSWINNPMNYDTLKDVFEGTYDIGENTDKWISSSIYNSDIYKWKKNKKKYYRQNGIIFSIPFYLKKLTYNTGKWKISDLFIYGLPIIKNKYMNFWARYYYAITPDYQYFIPMSLFIKFDPTKNFVFNYSKDILKAIADYADIPMFNVYNYRNLYYNTDIIHFSYSTTFRNEVYPNKSYRISINLAKIKIFYVNLMFY